MQDQTAGGTAKYNDVPTGLDMSNGLDSTASRHLLDDQIRMFQEGMLYSIKSSLSDTAVDTKEGVGVIMQALRGDQAAQGEISRFARNVYSALTDPETLQKLAHEIGERGDELRTAVENGNTHDTGMMLGAAMTEIVGPSKGKALRETAELGGNASKAARLGESAAGMGENTAKSVGKTADVNVSEMVAKLPDPAAEIRKEADAHAARRETMGPWEKIVDTVKGEISPYPTGHFPSRNQKYRMATAEDDKVMGLVIGNALMGHAGKGLMVAGLMAYAAHEADSIKESQLATLPENERKALEFEQSAGIAKKEAAAIKKYPELQPFFESYHSSADAATKLHPGEGGRVSHEASGEMSRARTDLIKSIKHSEPVNKAPQSEQHSAADEPTPEQKITAAALYIQMLPEHQRGPYLEKVAEYANKSGMTVEETKSAEHEAQRA